MKRDTNFEVKATSRWVLGDGYNPREAEDPTLRPSTMEEGICFTSKGHTCTVSYVQHSQRCHETRQGQILSIKIQNLRN